MKNIFSIIVIISIIVILPIPSAFAQTNLDAAFSYNIIDKEAIDGDIVTYANNGLTRTAAPYSPNIFGIIQKSPIIVIELNKDENNRIVVRSGIAKINVINSNGPIKKGNYITSSATAGKGQRADKSGYMLGVALEDSSTNGQVLVALDIKYVDLYSSLPTSANKFLKSLDNILLSSTQNPQEFTKLIRYLAASLITIGAFIISFLTFSRSMSNAVEALGRNPMANKHIYFSLFINAAVAIISVITGLAVAFILIKL